MKYEMTWREYGGKRSLLGQKVVEAKDPLDAASKCPKKSSVDIMLYRLTKKGKRLSAQLSVYRQEDVDYVLVPAFSKRPAVSKFRKP